MSGKFLNLILFAILASVCCDAVPIENRALVNNQNLFRGLIDIVLKTQKGTIDRIRDAVVTSNGDLSKIVIGVNGVLGTTVLKIDSNLLKVDLQGSKTLIKNAAQVYARQIYPDNPLMQLMVQITVESQLRIHEEDFRHVLDTHVLPVSVLQSLLTVKNLADGGRSRQKRDLFSDIGGMINGLIFGTVQNILVSSLESVKTNLASQIIPVQPEGALSAILAFIQNMAIQKGIEIVTLIQLNINGTLNGPIGGGEESFDVVSLIQQIIDALLDWN